MHGDYDDNYCHQHYDDYGDDVHDGYGVGDGDGDDALERQGLWRFVLRKTTILGAQIGVPRGWPRILRFLFLDRTISPLR